MKLVSFSNKRPVAEQGSFLTASQTEGKLRITAVVAEAMGVVEGDYVAVGKDQESGKLYAYVGMKDDKLQVGNKLTAAGQTFEFGSKNAWEEIGGNTDHSVRYNVAETPLEVTEGEEVIKFWELTDKTDLPRVDRKSGSDSNEGEEAEAPVVETATSSVEAEDEGFSLD